MKSKKNSVRFGECDRESSIRFVLGSGFGTAGSGRTTSGGSRRPVDYGHRITTVRRVRVQPSLQANMDLLDCIGRWLARLTHRAVARVYDPNVVADCDGWNADRGVVAQHHRDV